MGHGTAEKPLVTRGATQGIHTVCEQEETHVHTRKHIEGQTREAMLPTPTYQEALSIRHLLRQPALINQPHNCSLEAKALTEN